MDIASLKALVRLSGRVYVNRMKPCYNKELRKVNV